MPHRPTLIPKSAYRTMISTTANENIADYFADHPYPWFVGNELMAYPLHTRFLIKSVATHIITNKSSKPGYGDEVEITVYVQVEKID